MRYPVRSLHVDRYVLHAVAATLTVVILPIVAVWSVLAVIDPDPHPLATSSLGLGLALTASVGGAAWWMRRPDSADISFGELMLWSWLRRKRAEDKLSSGTRLLGLDEPGIAIDHPLSPHEQLELLKDLSAALESKDPYTHGHSRRVERHSYRTGLAMGLHLSDLDDLRKAAALHDVGKVRVPDRVLRKPGDLTIEERAIVESHVTVGAWMVTNVGNKDVVAGVRHHHERWDGTGYPDGVAGTDIPLLARIIAVADAYDAMTSTRPYRASLGKDPAIDGLLRGSGTQFDPEIVRAFLESLPRPVVAPLAGLFLVFAGPGRVLRELAVRVKQTGATAVAPAAGAAGAVAVLTVGLVSPAASLPEVAPANPVVAAPTTDLTAPTLPESQRRERRAVAQAPPRRNETFLFAPQVLGERITAADPDGDGGLPGDPAPPSRGGDSPPRDTPAPDDPPANETPPSGDDSPPPNEQPTPEETPPANESGSDQPPAAE
ncbi:MAG: HD domain-containing phosphohydrolase, partial [Actinomycetota bacterium]